jgi:hypothetical protein
MDKKIARSSLDISRHGTYTQDWNWRFDLKAEDTFDCVDDYGIWYRSTVVSVSELEN